MAAPLRNNSADRSVKAKFGMSSNYSEKQAEQPNSNELMLKAVQYHQKGDFNSAVELYEQALNADPANVKLLYLCGIVYIDMEDFQKAVDILSFATTLSPKDPLLHDSLSSALWGIGKLAPAISCCNTSLKLNPNSVETWYSKGCLLLLQKKEREAITAFEEVIKLDQTHYMAYGKLSEAHSACDEQVIESYYIKLFQHHSPDPIDVNLIDTRDIFFLDSSLALKIANKNNRIPQTVHISARQVCYYSGTKIQNAPENLIHVPAKQIVPFFKTSKLRFPYFVEYNPEVMQERATALSIAKILEKINASNSKSSFLYSNRSQLQKPEFIPGEPLRFFLSASRLTTVMQYSSRNIAKALLNKGCDVKLDIEESDMEEIIPYQRLKAHYDFNPHCVININYINNSWLHPDVYNIIWWQDYMHGVEEENYNLRERDIVLTADPSLTPYLTKAGIKDIKRQEFCVDTNVFQNKTPLEERHKSVFVGVSYTSRLNHIAGEKEALDLLQQEMDRGVAITTDYMHFVAKKTDLPYQYVYDVGPTFTHVVRQTAVKWLCELAPDIDLEVEIYGRGWDDDPIISPFYKGPIEHGPKIAKLYNETKYAVSASPYVVDSQRLSEISACGVIPIMYDARPFAPTPHWDDECLWFVSQDEFNNCFTQKPKNSPEIIAQTNSYDAFADRIIEFVKL
ncbi:MAG: tetratricopeptide repeat protein [Magnetococcales bacterium]|nr:tetratricopeptide repeat protein [Magnetococcales bacterium]